MKTLFCVLLMALGIVVLAHSRRNFKTPVHPINQPGMHLAAKVNPLILPAEGMLMLVGGILLLLVKPMSVRVCEANSPTSEAREKET